MTSLDQVVDEALAHLDDTPGSDRPAPYIAALPVGALFADHAYQRDLDGHRVQKMADELDPTLLGVIEVSDRGDGTYAILDGQHRWAAAAEVRYSRDLVCQVHRELTVEEEARVFYEIDRRRKQLSGWDRWKARVASGDPVALELDDIVRARGLCIDPAPRDGHVSATRALENLRDTGGGKLVDDTLAIAQASWGVAREAYEGTLLQAIALVLRGYDQGEIDLERLVTKLQGETPRQIRALARGKGEEHRGKSMPTLTAAVIVDLYNAGAARGARIEGLLSRALTARITGRTKGDAQARRNDAIRRWGARNGFALTKTGYINGRLRDAYAAAHPDGAT